MRRFLCRRGAGWCTSYHTNRQTSGRNTSKLPLPQLVWRFAQPTDQWCILRQCHEVAILIKAGLLIVVVSVTGRSADDRPTQPPVFVCGRRIAGCATFANYLASIGGHSASHDVAISSHMCAPR